MILSKEYKNVLKHFNTVNKNMFFVKGNKQSTIIGTNSGPVLFVRYTSNEEILNEFAVPDLGTLLTIFDMFEDFNLNVGDKKLIVEGNNKHIELTLTKKEFIQYEKNPDRFPQTEGLTINFSSEMLDEINKLSSVLKTPHIYIEAKNFRLSIGTEDCSNPTTDSSKFDLGSIHSDREFKYVLEKENLRIMKDNYRLVIPEKKYLYFDNNNTEHRLEYYFPINSKFSK